MQTINIPASLPVFTFTLYSEDNELADSALAKIGVSRTDAYCVVHPGSGGSAMDWRPESYAEACRLFTHLDNLTVVLSWGNVEQKLAEYIVHNSHQRVKALPLVLPLPALAAVLQRAAFLLAPSTGILHLANAVGTPVIGLYPPIPWESPIRWGPYGNSGITFVPDREKCPVCRGRPCRKKGCMDLITPQMVFEAAGALYKVKRQ